MLKRRTLLYIAMVAIVKKPASNDHESYLKKQFSFQSTRSNILQLIGDFVEISDKKLISGIFCYIIYLNMCYTTRLQEGQGRTMYVIVYTVYFIMWSCTLCTLYHVIVYTVSLIMWLCTLYFIIWLYTLYYTLSSDCVMCTLCTLYHVIVYTVRPWKKVFVYITVYLQNYNKRGLEQSAYNCKIIFVVAMRIYSSYVSTILVNRRKRGRIYDNKQFY